MLARYSIAFMLMLMAFLSLSCSLLLVVTCWTGITFFVFGPLSIYFGWKSYKKQLAARGHRASAGVRLLALAPMLIAVATIPLSLMFLNATYRA